MQRVALESEPGEVLVPTEREVRTWTQPRLLEHLQPILANYHDTVGQSFASSFVDGDTFMDHFGNREIYAHLGIPFIPGIRLAKEVHRILGTATSKSLKRRFRSNFQPIQ